MGRESSDVFRFHLRPLSRSNDGSLALLSCLFGGYKFALVLRCIGLVGIDVFRALCQKLLAFLKA